MSTIRTRSIGACVKSGRHRRALPRSERQFDSIHDAQQIQEAVDAHYEFRKPNSSELYWDLYPRFPALSSFDDHEALNDAHSSAQQELARSGDLGNDPNFCFVECQSGEKSSYHTNAIYWCMCKKRKTSLCTSHKRTPVRFNTCCATTSRRSRCSL